MLQKVKMMDPRGLYETLIGRVGADLMLLATTAAAERELVS